MFPQASTQQTAALLLVLQLLAFDLSAVGGEYTSQSLSTHLDTLLAEYDREVAPAPPAGPAPLPVAVSLDVRHAAVDDRASTMRMLADLKMGWTDPRLTWNATEWEADGVLVSAERVWTPDVALQNAAGGGGAGDAALRARLAARGAVSLVLRLDLTVPLALDLVRWPRDTQEAVFKFASRAHSAQEIKLVMVEYKNALVVECGAWEVVGVSGAEDTVTRADGGAASAVQWGVRAARRDAAGAGVARAVLAAAVALLAAAAALPHTQRAPLAACATLVSADWLLTAINHIPASSSSPRVMSVMCCVCVAGAACGAAAAAAGRVSRRAGAAPASLRALLSKVSAVYPLTPHPEQEECPGQSGAWAAAARLLDAAALLALGLTLLVLVAVYLLA